MSDRWVTLDTETTGLEVSEGHKLIEVGALELINRRKTGAVFNRRVNPGREMEADAVRIHGITTEMLADKPTFAEIAEDFLQFIQGAAVIIHNAPFDLGFLNAELEAAGFSSVEDNCAEIIDSLLLARDKYPYKKNNMDALCDRHDIDTSERKHHGALVDANLLAEVYLAMTGGQTTLDINEQSGASEEASGGQYTTSNIELPPAESLDIKLVLAGPEELAAHEELLSEMSSKKGVNCLWHQQARS